MPWVTLNWFWSVGWSVTFGGSGVFPIGFQWLAWCIDQLGSGLLGWWWQSGKVAAFYVWLVILLLALWGGLDLLTRPFVWIVVRCIRVWLWLRGEPAANPAWTVHDLE